MFFFFFFCNFTIDKKVIKWCLGCFSVFRLYYHVVALESGTTLLTCALLNDCTHSQKQVFRKTLKSKQFGSQSHGPEAGYKDGSR